MRGVQSIDRHLRFREHADWVLSMESRRPFDLVLSLLYTFAMSTPEYKHLLRKSLDAKRGGIDAWSVQSTGEKVCVALVLNRADWLTSMDYTLAEAIDRAGEWLRVIPQVARTLRDEETENAG